MAELRRVLMVDDDTDLCAMVAEYLQAKGYTVRTAAGSREMDSHLGAEKPDLLILDINMPGESGFSIARRIRERDGLPILMLSGAHDIVDKISCFKLGADDYLTKPFDLRELLARVDAVLRRSATTGMPRATLPARIEFGDTWLDLASRRLLRSDGADVKLTAMEFDLLEAFGRHPNCVLSRERLLDLAHQRCGDVFDRSIDVRITRLRRKIERDPTRPELIKTMHGVGYMFVPAKGHFSETP